jgi:hypothetical protein
MMTTSRVANQSQKSTNSLGGRLVALVVMAVALGAAAGCSPVAPYDRGRLAHPTMAANDTSSFGESHLRAISEGAVGGSAGAGSGCGCN